MRGTQVARSQTDPFRIEPEIGHASEYGVESSNSEPAHVLQEESAGSNVANDPLDMLPDPTLVGLGELLPGLAERLTREAGRDEINPAAIREAVEGLEIVPNKRPIQGLVFHPRHESGRCVGVPLNVTHSSIVRSGEADPKLEPSIPGT